MLLDKDHLYNQRSHELVDIYIKIITDSEKNEKDFYIFYEVIMKHQDLFGIKFPFLLNSLKTDHYAHHYQYEHVERDEEFNIRQLALEEILTNVLTERKVELKEEL